MNSFTPKLLALALLAAALTATANAQGVGPCFEGPVGLQLYSLRDGFKTNVPGTLDEVRKFGFQHVELAGLYNLPPEQFRTMLAERGLKPIAGHWPYDLLKKDPEAVAAQARALNLKYAGCAWISHKAPFDEAQCRDAAATFNRAGEVMARHGMKVYYHNHGYEFQPHGDGTLMDLLISLTDPKLVCFQMDLLWTIFPGQDPAKLLAKHGARWELLHLKDLRKGVKGDLTGHTDVKNDVALGTGQIDFPAVLKAAKAAGVKWYFIEDESPDVRAQLPVSLRFLEQVRW